MMYARMPRLTPEDRLMRLQPLDLSGARLDPGAIVKRQSTPTTRVRVAMLNGRARFHPICRRSACSATACCGCTSTSIRADSWRRTATPQRATRGFSARSSTTLTSSCSSPSSNAASRDASPVECRAGLFTTGCYVYAGVEGQNWKELREEAGFIHDVVVAPDARAQGIGAQLIDAASIWCRERGMPRVLLWVAEQNAGAQRLFDRAGFRRTMIEMTREL